MSLRRFLADEAGATALEYAFIASLIGMLIIGGASSIGITLEATFDTLAAAF
jgi:pilus assembly protein Flp/PilA